MSSYARIKNGRIMRYRCRPFICPSVPFTLSSQLLLNPWGDFDETWYKERSQCGDVHIARGVLSNVF